MNEARARQLYPEAVQLSALASSRFGESWNSETQCAELVRVDDLKGEQAAIAIFTDEIGYDDRRLLVKSPELIAALLLLLKIAFEKIRQQNPPPKKGKDFAAEAHRKCSEDKAFRRYLIERHDLPEDADENRTKIRLRTLLQVQSLGELNENTEAAERWKHFRASFNAWIKGN